MKVYEAVANAFVKDAKWQKELERSLAEPGYQDSTATLKYWQVEYAEMKALDTVLGLAKQ